MKTLLLKNKVLVKALSLAFVLIVLSYASFAADNKAGVADTGSNKYNVVKTQTTTTVQNANSYERELNLITDQISAAIKFRATPIDYESNPILDDADLNSITEEVAKSVKFQPNISL